MKKEFVGIVKFEQPCERIINLNDKFVGVIVVETILKDQLTGCWVLSVEGDKKHRALIIEIDSKWAVFSLEPYLKQFETVSLQAQP